MLGLGEGFLGDIGQDHRIEGLELGQVDRQRVAADAPRAVDRRGDQDLDLDVLVVQGLDQLGVLSPGTFDQEDLGLALRWVKPSALLLIARRSPLPFSGLNSALNV